MRKAMALTAVAIAAFVIGVTGPVDGRDCAEDEVPMGDWCIHVDELEED